MECHTQVPVCNMRVCSLPDLLAYDVIGVVLASYGDVAAAKALAASCRADAQCAILASNSHKLGWAMLGFDEAACVSKWVQSTECASVGLSSADPPAVRVLPWPCDAVSHVIRQSSRAVLDPVSAVVRVTGAVQGPLCSDCMQRRYARVRIKANQLGIMSNTGALHQRDLPVLIAQCPGHIQCVVDGFTDPCPDLRALPPAVRSMTTHSTECDLLKLSCALAHLERLCVADCWDVTELASLSLSLTVLIGQSFPD